VNGREKKEGGQKIKRKERGRRQLLGGGGNGVK